jgi:phosphatidylserine/phosphatidylglycerophosphate/cardiolipin synthase-like enzyme
VSAHGQIEFVTDRQIFERVLAEAIPAAERFVWIATADLKDAHVPKGKKFVPFLEILSDLLGQGVEVRLIHAKEPGPVFRKDFDRYPNVIQGLERLLCPRIHFKSVVVDGAFAYSGSANLTGAGMGAKSEGKRNFEAGFITRDRELVHAVMAQFDSVWMGARCGDCRRREFCGDAPDMLGG